MLFEQEYITKETDTIRLLRERKICIVIPTYNNVGTISDVIHRTLLQCGDIIVVNDGSTDGTGELLRKTTGIILLENTKNKGKGSALKRGLLKAKEMGYVYAITLDADGQHYPEDIPLLLEKNIQHPEAIIIGKRKLDGVIRSGGSKFANAFGNFWFCVQTLQWQPDTQSGYRLYPLHKLHFLSLLTSRYEAELELLVPASWNGVKIVSVPVDVYYPPQDKRVSHFRPVADFARIFLLNTFLCALAFVWGYPFFILRALLTFARTAFALLVYMLGLCTIMPFAFVYVPFAKLTGKGKTPLYTILHAYGKLVTWLLQIIQCKVTIYNTHHENFERPAIITCNHQSHLDLMILLGLTRKIVFLTNDRVYNNPFYGYILRHAEYYPVSMGYDKLKPKLKELSDNGFCIAIFPEGTRSKDSRIGKFYKGAFQLANDLHLDLLPLVLYGAGRALSKNCWWMSKSPIELHIESRITPTEQEQLGSTIQERTKRLRRFYINGLSAISNKIVQHV
jgi:1-acyl-sn-glycerol-3-phosphate acyltransferase